MINQHILLCFVVILILLTICELFVFDTFMCDITERFEDKLTSKEKINLLRCMLTLHELFVLHNVWYNISFGTLLGSVRHKKIIPWDDDIDLIVLKNDMTKMQKIFDVLTNDYGYKVEKSWKLIRVYADDSHFIDLFCVNNINGIITRCTIKETECVTVDEEWWTKWFGFPSTYLGVGMENGLIGCTKRMYQIDGLNLYGPENPWDILRYWYNDDFLSSCKTQELENHETPIDVKVKKCESYGVPNFGTLQ
jgi:hypothetical protein